MHKHSHFFSFIRTVYKCDKTIRVPSSYLNFWIQMAFTDDISQLIHEESSSLRHSTAAGFDQL